MSKLGKENDMEYEEVLKSIVDFINEKLREKCIQSFYIGKTLNFEERKQQHESERYSYIWKLAIGSCKIIARLEDLIIYYKCNKPLLLANKNTRITGN